MGFNSGFKGLSVPTDKNLEDRMGQRVFGLYLGNQMFADMV